MKSLFVALWARRKRRLGDYDQATLAGFAAAWRYSQKLPDLLAYALFRRDLGRTLPTRWTVPLRQGLNRLRPGQRRLALGLLAEHGPAGLESVQPSWLAAAGGLPALASLGSPAVEPLVASIDTEQALWRAQFAAWVTERRLGGGLCVVGNAALLQGLALGSTVDAFAGVVRFNRFGTDAALLPDLGQRTDVWVVSPGYEGPTPTGVSWVVMTGPDVRYRLQDWRTVLPLRAAGVPVLTVPLAVWRSLVVDLQAPPSAGVLVLAWLASMGAAGNWNGLHLAGIGSGLTADGRYHSAAARHAGSSRHNWPAEQRLVASWQEQGLNRLCAPQASSAGAGLPWEKSPVAEPLPSLVVFSRGVLDLTVVPVLLGGALKLTRWRLPADTRAVLGWGRRPLGERALLAAQRAGLPFICLEDGFLRSFGTGQNFPPLSLVVDDQGIYYDSTQPSALESLLASPVDVLAGMAGDVERARALVLGHRLSKYNHAGEGARYDGEGIRVLVIDQTAGDLSVSLGGATAETFVEMLAAARAENPLATIYVKTHPEVTSGRKGGYLTQVQNSDLNGQRTVVLREAINPLSLIEQMDRVYVVTSTMGFEALLAGKPVSVFGMPWYAGWGATDDRLTNSPAYARRTRTRSVQELFAAAYFHYTRYLNPVTHQRGTVFDVISWLVLQRKMATRMHGASWEGRVIGIGFWRWRTFNFRSMLGLHTQKVCFASTVQSAEAMAPSLGDTLVCWGAHAPAGFADMARACRARLLHLEDGFVRSVGLGSDLIRPLSLVLDERGIYFDATRPSDLEHMLSNREFGPDDMARAQAVRAFIVEHGITKYNLEPRHAVNWQADGRTVVLVPGQVEDDASIALGCTTVNTNLGLLQAVRRVRPDVFIVYKPHPDVLSRNRKGKVALQAARQFADHIEAGVSVVSCIEAADEVHTMTSLSGFDALLRGKKVVTYGQPFYAGWGLTEDRAERAAAFGRRQRRLSLDELVAGALLHYPIYWDWDLKGYTTCEAVLRRIVEQRTALETNGGLHKLRVGWLRRQLRKLNLLARAMIDWSARRGSNPRPSA